MIRDIRLISFITGSSSNSLLSSSRLLYHELCPDPPLSIIPNKIHPTLSPLCSLSSHSPALCCSSHKFVFLDSLDLAVTSHSTFLKSMASFFLRSTTFNSFLISLFLICSSSQLPPLVIPSLPRSLHHIG